MVLLHTSNAHSIDQTQIQSIVLFVLYLILTAYNLLYFCTRILKLNLKKFHLMMFILLQLCYFSILTKSVFLWFTTSTDDFDILLSYDVYYFLNEVVHSIFVVKYWVMAHKISLITRQKDDTYLECKAWAIVLSLSALIVATSVADVVFALNGQFD